jgi:hypothetical protein
MQNIVKFFQKFEVGYIQICTPLEKYTMWHLKRGHCNVFSPSTMNILFYYKLELSIKFND